MTPVKFLALLGLFLASQLMAEDTRVTTLVQQGDQADARHDAQGALSVLRQAEDLDSKNFGVVLRISKQYTDLIDRAKNKEEAHILADKALDYGKRAVVLDGDNAKAHLNLAICYGKLTDFVSNKTKMEYARLIHDEAARSIELDAKDDYAWHVLGRWHAGVANLNGVLKTLAGLVYGGLPPASNEDAVRCLKKATELAPQRMMHHAELAKAYTAAGQPDRAAQEWQNVLGIRPVDTQDEQYQKDAKTALDAARQTRGRAAAAAGVARR